MELENVPGARKMKEILEEVEKNGLRARIEYVELAIGADLKDVYETAYETCTKICTNCESECRAYADKMLEQNRRYLVSILNEIKEKFHAEVVDVYDDLTSLSWLIRFALY